MNLIYPFKDILHRKDDEQNKNFKPFIFIPNLFNNEEIELINNLWNENKMKEGKVKRDGEGYVNYNTRKSKNSVCRCRVKRMAIWKTRYDMHDFECQHIQIRHKRISNKITTL